MSSASALRTQIEAALAERIPSALTPAPRIIRPRAATGILQVDELTEGGLPVGALSEICGAQSSGRTTLALSFLAQLTQGGRVCVWIDVSDGLQPESAAAAGVDLARLLWVRCGVATNATVQPAGAFFALPERCLIPPPITRGLHGGGCGPHPRSETKGLSQSVGSLLQWEAVAPRCAEPQRRTRMERERFEGAASFEGRTSETCVRRVRPWSRIEQGLRVADLLLQAGGFSAIVLDMADIAAEHAARVPLATWFRYRAAAERTLASFLLLTQRTCAKSSAEVVLRMCAGDGVRQESTVLTGFAYHVEVSRRRFAEGTKVVPLRKPPQREDGSRWCSQTVWAGRR
jgi:recombination protein RecA